MTKDWCFSLSFLENIDVEQKTKLRIRKKAKTDKEKGFEGESKTGNQKNIND